ncbi:right-handed parallel beta-helix repeat-containing protein [Paraglaciecola aquimarina]|uniref:Right-handed parallel beta-helix repeat-containing protein n=1 Tax=Paraglaciecola aquimarina TaxID=1235557 RepID=A0ABU3T151_9ALTE|nr:right-handed parallel beta-helix repeat-containing protein [Paraglaciecola aquimarina]MDU0355978.1 right-handed parallel beta-helix repeat-containing protein [Paraglaciecola aquimarina]
MLAKAVIQLSKTASDKNETWIALALKLYPIDAYRILEQLYVDSYFEESTLESAALIAGLEPNLIFTATATNDLEYRVVPLIHSASLTVYNQQQDANTRLWFKPSTSSEWLPTLALQWEPILGALSGSIVHLQPNTSYDIKLEYLDDTQVIDERLYSFQTRPNSPPIDPEKIYYLSDIYTGGQLNLTDLGIEGSEDGWALIIGDGPEIIASVEDYAAIDIGSQSYIKFENIMVKGGQKYGITAKDAHHLWIDGCNVSEFGRVGEDIRNGVAYETAESTSPINYDSGIYLRKTGVVTIENCEVHSPNGKANSWQYGHPYGPSAMLLWAYHSTEEYRGQYIIRNNRFYGTPEHRFNDVIESRSNFRPWGGFVRDSAIHNNYLAYANDDLVELDGGQSNVLFYDNELTQGFCGISVAPNMFGPSYIFNNYIHDLGDDRDKEWAAIKMGGLIARPAGITNLFENLIIINNNGVARSGVENDRTFWLNAQNNIIISKKRGGRGIYDQEFYQGSTFKNNIIYNTYNGAPYVEATIDDDFYHPWSEQADKINSIVNSDSTYYIESDTRFNIPNFSSSTSVIFSPAASTQLLSPVTTDSIEPINFYDKSITPFDNQDKNGDYLIEDNGYTIVLSGNAWKSIDLPYKVNLNTVIQLDVKTNGLGEIIGVAIEDDNKFTSNKLFKFAGRQPTSQNQFRSDLSDSFKTLTLPIGKFMAGMIDRLVFVLDEDSARNTLPEAQFKNVKIYDKPDIYTKTLQQYGTAPSTTEVDFSSAPISSFSNQDKDNNYVVTGGGDALTLYGNTWKSVKINHKITPQTLLEFEMKTNGAGEIAGMAFENDSRLTNSRLYKLDGRQKCQNDLFEYSSPGNLKPSPYLLANFQLQIWIE